MIIIVLTLTLVSIADPPVKLTAVEKAMLPLLSDIDEPTFTFPGLFNGEDNSSEKIGLNLYFI